MWRGPCREGAYWTVHRVISDGRRRVRLCTLFSRFSDTKGCSEWEGMFSSRYVVDKISKPKRYCYSVLPKVHVSGSQRTKNSSSHVDRRPCFLRLGMDRANIWSIATVLPGASLPVSGSTVVWIFLLCPGLLCGMWSFIFAERAGPPWGWERVARNLALWMESCLETASTTKGGVLSGIVPHYISRMDFHRWAMGSSQPDCLATLLLRMCRWAILVEASVALRYLKAWTKLCGIGNHTDALAHMSSLFSRK